ncbi:hypothetical protein KJ359_011225 [Pestalotiopsis sp. 9143b]|nr:hypothetical protein KJ359_011225 [Pestalotiopsis sp. 9143b]
MRRRMIFTIMVRSRNLLSDYNDPNVTVMAMDIPEKIAAELSKAKTAQDVQNGLRKHYAVFNNGGGWGEVTLLDAREGLESFINWACALHDNGPNEDWASFMSEDPSRAPKTFKLCNARSPVLVLALRRPIEEKLSGTSDYITELLLNTAEIEASMAKGLLESITVPEFSDDEDEQVEEDEQDGEDEQTDEDEQGEEGGDDEDECQGI